jgi:nitrite reductase/ring-hydroxylating ferredoxin subunit
VTRGLSRRQTLTGAAALGTVPLLAACGGGGGSNDTATEPPAAGETLGPVADVPVGGGTIYPDQKVVVTQPTEGDFRGFSAVCTHQACLVATVTESSINCTCHGSKFSVEDGSVLNGPATSPLSRITVTVDGGELTTG